MDTQKFDLYEFGNSLEGKQRTMFFHLGAEVQSSKNRSMGFHVDPHHCHELALIALDSTNWKSLKAAKAMLSVMRAW